MFSQSLLCKRDNLGVAPSFPKYFSEKDSVGHKRETVGLGICIPRASLVQELEPTTDNYGYEVAIRGNQFHYRITFGSDNEDFGYHNASDWFDYLKLWKRDIEQPVNVKILPS